MRAFPCSRCPPLVLAALLALAVGCPPAPPAEVYTEVEFDLTVPPETPVTAAVFLQGEHPAFRGSERGLELVYQGGRMFSARAKLPEGQPVSFSARLFPAGATGGPAGGSVALERSGRPTAPWSVQPRADEEKVDFTVQRWGPPEGKTGPETVFLVAVPGFTPQEASIYLSGNQPELGERNPAGVKVHKAMDSLYATSLSFKPGTSLKFKATRGSWATVEKGAMGEEIADRGFTTGAEYEQVQVEVEQWADLNGSPPPPAELTDTSAPPPAVLTGNIERFPVTPGNALLKPREVIVWLPPGYEKEENQGRRYPVLYMHDGQNLMDSTTSFSVEWNVDETAQRLVEAGEVEPLIVVGVYNTADRIDEYTPVPFAPNYPDAGRADLYGDFLVQELKPLIDGKYRTRTDAASTGLAGSSLGGLVSLYLGLKHPDVFTRLGVISPSVWWADKDILQQVEKLPGKLPLRIWEDIGTDEGDGPEAETEADAALLRDALQKKGWSDADLKYTVYPGGKHDERTWSDRFDDILRFLYPAVP